MIPDDTTLEYDTVQPNQLSSTSSIHFTSGLPALAEPTYGFADVVSQVKTRQSLIVEYVCECIIESFDPGAGDESDFAPPSHSKIFPVKKVNYTIESLGRKPDLFHSLDMAVLLPSSSQKTTPSTKAFFDEQIIFEIWTNGAISPQKALEYALSYSIALFQKFIFS